MDNKQLEEILQGCRLNLRKSQKELYMHYYSYAMSVALRYASGHDNAVEMVNDGFLRVFKDLKNFTPHFEDTRAAFSGWLRKVLVHACIDHLRKYDRKEMKSGTDLEKITLADTQQNAEQVLQYEEILKCVQQLPPAYKAAFNLYVIEGFSHEEIAELLHISVGSSKSNLFKAKKKLQEMLVKSNAIES